MNRRVLPLLLGLVAVACVAAGGARFWGRVALMAGEPARAARLLEDPGARGVALYRAGRFAEADAAFAEAGRAATYNRALTLALTGRHALSVAYFDAVLFAAPQDRQARENRDIVAALIEPVIGENGGEGRIDKAIAAANAARQALEGPGRRGGRRLQRRDEARSIVVTDEWLETLTDEPGAYLRKRLQAEYDRRAAQGLVAPPGAPRW